MTSSPHASQPSPGMPQKPHKISDKENDTEPKKESLAARVVKKTGAAGAEIIMDAAVNVAARRVAQKVLGGSENSNPNAEKNASAENLQEENGVQAIHSHVAAVDSGHSDYHSHAEYGWDSQPENGVVDAVMLDADSNGAIDAVVFDSDQNGVADAVVVDANEDGFVDAVAWDADEDGAVDAVAIDADYDGDADLTEFTTESYEDDALTDDGAYDDYDDTPSWDDGAEEMEF